MTVEDRYKGHWRNVQDNCLLCEMEKRTNWYIETRSWVVAEKLGGGPFVVSKHHKKELSDDEWDKMERIVGLAGFNDFEIDVRMSLVKSHWHGHIITDDSIDLSDE